MNSMKLNGQDWPLPMPISIGQLLDRSGLAEKRVAVERNGEVVPRSHHGEVLVHQGDRIEIIVAVGGG